MRANLVARVIEALHREECSARAKVVAWAIMTPKRSLDCLHGEASWEEEAHPFRSPPGLG